MRECKRIGSGVLPLALLFALLFGATLGAVPAFSSDAPVSPSSGEGQSYHDLMERAASLYRTGRFDPAILLFRKAEERGAPREIIAFNIGNCRYRTGDLPRAAAAYRRAIRLAAGEYPSALLNLAAVLYRMGEYSEAAATYRRLLRTDPEQIDGWIFLAEACTRTGDLVCAQQALEKGHRLSPDDVGVVYRLAEVHVSLGEIEPAIERIRAAYRLYPEEIDFLFYIGDLHRSVKNWDGAAAAYREGLTLRPEDPDALYKLADVLAEGEKPFLAMETLQKLLLLKPEFSDAAVFLGNLAADRHWNDRAEQAYLQASRSGNDEGIQGLRNLAYEAEQRNDLKEALRLIELALTFNPKNRTLAEEAEYYRALLPPI